MIEKREKGRRSSEDGSFMSAALKVGYVTAYWGAKPKRTN